MIKKTYKLNSKYFVSLLLFSKLVIADNYSVEYDEQYYLGYSPAGAEVNELSSGEQNGLLFQCSSLCTHSYVRGDAINFSVFTNKPTFGIQGGNITVSGRSLIIDENFEPGSYIVNIDVSMYRNTDSHGVLKFNRVSGGMKTNMAGATYSTSSSGRHVSVAMTFAATLTPGQVYNLEVDNIYRGSSIGVNGVSVNFSRIQ